jgi:hypothetical protein
MKWNWQNLSDVVWWNRCKKNITSLLVCMDRYIWIKNGMIMPETDSVYRFHGSQRYNPSGAYIDDTLVFYIIYTITIIVFLYFCFVWFIKDFTDVL